ncbi:putative RING finger domain protein [Aspergillus clavatus NRRL 1]|uniref:RING finger domain protein, putative n=1 Tax=Aspergillus clavatus (strain ATCC 1007 / CBS 513.65 / DSM 816 / NCTC 3887 / NRRL 1 / QM 1276 / 107) TaxID=344612 RepID=A1C624_ASPCL|nr:RING finger domain protein, putative [Aspergillus clavatus NRRL 1]EAW13845.1 RING finger domain protein, putative [Aspergillus clavatus NRRL 1]
MGPRTKPSGSPSSSLQFLLLLFLLLLTFSSSVRAIESSIGCTVLPSNNSTDLSFTNHKRFHLQSARFNFPPGVIIAPLTQSLVDLNGTDLQSFNVTGNLVGVNAQNSLQLNTGDIAFVSCDPSVYPGNLDASATVTNLLTAQDKAAAVLLYSTSASHCNYTVNDGAAGQYPNVFTLLDSAFATTLNFQPSPLNGDQPISIVYNMSFVGTVNPPTSDGPADSPNTAMIILYSITGIITALFLAIIITGAIRAHRHPERYGPRYTAGRPRQSRARGIARAMLDTIPIVKFGDNYDPKADAVKGDVEMSTGTEEHGVTRPNERQEVPAADGALQPDANDRTNSEIAHSPASTERHATPAPGENESPTDHPNFSCPICTDDFIKGQDLRVLPCNHQFHPECIDPWLVNVSGTCPLCRIDLNPAQAEEDNEHGEAEASPDHPNAPTADATPNRQHRRISSYLHGTLNARRMRDATVEERLAALRSVREAASRGAQNEDADERQHRRSRLTARLRDRFRIRTRTHGVTEATERA